MRWAALLGSVAFLAGCAFISVPLQPPPTLEEQVVGGSGRAKVVLVDIDGLIASEPLGLGRFTREPPLVPRLREMLERAAADRRVVALVVRIDSAGGSVTASDILYHEIAEYRRRQEVPVVACVMDKALSGGYYAALAADEIFVHPTAVIGGVGVISWRVNLSALLERWGIATETVQSGSLKDFWSPLRGSRPEEVAIMQEIVNGLHRRFLGLVQERRSLPPGQIDRVASGRLFAAEEAVEIGLADRLGYLEDALARARGLASVEEARTVIYRRPGAFAGNVYAAAPPLLRQAAFLEELASQLLVPGFRYQVLP